LYIELVKHRAVVGGAGSCQKHTLLWQQLINIGISVLNNYKIISTCRDRCALDSWFVGSWFWIGLLGMVLCFVVT